MMVRIVRQPLGRIEGISLSHYRVGHTYELPPSIAEYLVMEGYAKLEMRRIEAFVNDTTAMLAAWTSSRSNQQTRSSIVEDFPVPGPATRRT